jgi:hypothetical protein
MLKRRRVKYDIYVSHDPAKLIRIPNVRQREAGISKMLEALLKEKEFTLVIVDADKFVQVRHLKQLSYQLSPHRTACARDEYPLPFEKIIHLFSFRTHHRDTEDTEDTFVLPDREATIGQKSA